MGTHIKFSEVILSIPFKFLRDKDKDVLCQIFKILLVFGF